MRDSADAVVRTFMSAFADLWDEVEALQRVEPWRGFAYDCGDAAHYRQLLEHGTREGGEREEVSGCEAQRPQRWDYQDEELVGGVGKWRVQSLLLSSAARSLRGIMNMSVFDGV